MSLPASSVQFCFARCPVRHFVPQCCSRCYFKPWLTLGLWPSLCRHSGRSESSAPPDAGIAPHWRPRTELPPCRPRRAMEGVFFQLPAAPAALLQAAAQPQAEECIQKIFVKCRAGVKALSLLEGFRAEERNIYVLKWNIHIHIQGCVCVCIKEKRDQVQSTAC